MSCFLPIVAVLLGFEIVSAFTIVLLSEFLSGKLLRSSAIS